MSGVDIEPLSKDVRFFIESYPEWSRICREKRLSFQQAIAIAWRYLERDYTPGSNDLAELIGFDRPVSETDAKVIFSKLAAYFARKHASGPGEKEIRSAGGKDGARKRWGEKTEKEA